MKILHLIALLMSPLTASAQTTGATTPPASTAAPSTGTDCTPLPSVKVGSWTVSNIGGRKRKSTVTEVTETQIILKRESLSGDNLDSGTDSVTREWNAITLPNTTNRAFVTTYTPHGGTFRFPMCVGHSHQQPVTYQSGSFSGVFTMKSKVVAREKISIVAGEFDTFRVDWDTGSQRGTLWYSPLLGRTVKSQASTTNWELLEYGGN